MKWLFFVASNILYSFFDWGEHFHYENEKKTYKKIIKEEKEYEIWMQSGVEVVLYLCVCVYVCVCVCALLFINNKIAVVCF